MSVRFRRHYHLLLLFVAAVVVSGVALRNNRITAYTVAGAESARRPTVNYNNRLDLFDATVVHEVVVLIAADDQKKMVTTYQQTGNKDWFQADIIIDGVRINQVGIRLKGNASLRMAAGGMRGGMRGGPAGGNFAPLDGAPVPQEAQPPGAGRFRPPEGFQAPGGVPPQEGAGFSGTPTGALPYLVKLDRFVKGQRYQGLAEIALRTAGAFSDASVLQEPVTNYAMNSAGVPIARSAYVSVQVGDGQPRLYTVAEHVDQTYVDRLFPDSNGVLYKAVQPGNTFAYLGEDPTSYANVFDQETAINRADLAPLIAFIRFVNEASDQEFAEQLPGRFDVVAFADYLAVHNLLANNDSLAGMGHNYYLYYDFDAKKFTILSWDANESLGKMTMGGGSQMDIYWERVGGMFGRGFGGPAGSGRGTHLLLKRFLATPAFRTLYTERYRLLYERIYGRDLLAPKIRELTALVTAYNAGRGIVAQAAYNAAANKVLDFVAQRNEYLKSTDLLRP